MARIGSQLRLALTQRLALPLAHQPQILALLFAADRLDHVATEITPHLRDGYIVISDRYDLSSLCYQSMSTELDRLSTVERLEAEPVRPCKAPIAPPLVWIQQLNRYARRPDVTVVLDVSPQVAAQRRKLRGGAAELFENPEFQLRLAEVYRQCDALVPGDRVVHVNGDVEASDVEAQIIGRLEPILFGNAVQRRVTAERQKPGI